MHPVITFVLRSLWSVLGLLLAILLGVLAFAWRLLFARRKQCA